MSMLRYTDATDTYKPILPSRDWILTIFSPTHYQNVTMDVSTPAGANYRREIVAVPNSRSIPRLASATRPLGYHSTTYSQRSSPRRTHRVFVTLPLTPRARRMPS